MRRTRDSSSTPVTGTSPDEPVNTKKKLVPKQLTKSHVPKPAVFYGNLPTEITTHDVQNTATCRIDRPVKRRDALQQQGLPMSYEYPHPSWKPETSEENRQLLPQITLLKQENASGTTPYDTPSSRSREVQMC